MPSREMPTKAALAPLLPPPGPIEWIVVVLAFARSYTSMPASVSVLTSDSDVRKKTFEPSCETPS